MKKISISHKSFKYVVSQMEKSKKKEYIEEFTKEKNLYLEFSSTL